MYPPLVYMGCPAQGPTMKRQSSSYSVLAPAVLGYALVHASVLLLEAGNLQYGIGVPQLHLVGERITSGLSPADLWHWATTSTSLEA